MVQTGGRILHLRAHNSRQCAGNIQANVIPRVTDTVPYIVDQLLAGAYDVQCAKQAHRSGVGKDVKHNRFTRRVDVLHKNTAHAQKRRGEEGVDSDSTLRRHVLVCRHADVLRDFSLQAGRHLVQQQGAVVISRKINGEDALDFNPEIGCGKGHEGQE